ncbi:MAG: hypothetical protein WCV70_04075 [Patescibacteria group bacterium]|jgi:hypothetical protein
MKICQVKEKNKLFTFLLVSIFGIFLSFIIANNVLAQNPVYDMLGNKVDTSLLGEDGAMTSIKTSDSGTKKAEEKTALERASDQITDWAKTAQKWAEEYGAAIAFKAAVKNFLNNLAYDTATYLATGDWGQQPMFETRNFGTVVKDAADNAAGTFLEQWGKSGAIKFNVCQPNLNVQVKIGLGLQKTQRPTKPACTFTEMTKNWDTALKDKNFLPKFQDMFNPWSNDLGIALTLQTGMETEINKQANLALEEAKKNQGIKDVVDPISKFIKTPGLTVTQQMGSVFYDANKKELTYTGDITADAIDIFVNTLIGRLMDQWLKKGLVTTFPGTYGNLADINAQNQAEGAAGAANRMKSLIEPSFKVRGDYDILAELASCPDPNKAGPTNCVIDEKFREAIEKRLTVGQALEQGYLNANGIFGFNSDGLEPKFNEGYPYRSMLILRKFRIIPVGWEVAAEKIKDLQNQIGSTKNLRDLVNCSESWCAGLVDPNWVLKAPQNFCKKEGAGPEIISETVTGEGYESSLSVLRNDTYCADEQSCIKEKNDGSCQLYGYCTEERRKWDFNSKACDPRNNTCQTFSSPSGQAVSYLENTLDSSNCNIGNAGCLAYCQDYSLATSKFTCTNNSGNKIHLNNQAEACDKESEGCHELIRLNPGNGANLLVNSGLEKDLTAGDWLGFGSRTDLDAYQGGYSLKMNGSASRIIPIGNGDYSLAGENYVLSFYAKDCAAGDKFSIENKQSNLDAGSDWLRYNLAYAYSPEIDVFEIKFAINSSSCLIDNIKLERGDQTTAYSDYAAASSPSLIYEKVAPAYLNCSGANPPSECENFARYCSADEAGCELYTGVADGVKIPAKAAAQDYCPAECVGYNTYIQAETTFDSSRDAYFISKTAKTCSAEAVGCDQFTNLDEVAKGGEGIEYYTYLRQCLRQADNAGNCAEFYNWEGSDESGYQLKVESLNKTGSGMAEEPALSSPDAALCNEAIYNLPASDPAYNADCRQFYNRDGGLSYHLYSHTIACSDDCHPYRRTALNIDEAILSSASCVGSDKHWDDASEQCLVCKSGGVWSADNNACLYQAVPNQGITCAAAQNGCREYIGNTGNDVRNIFTDDFAEGTTGDWLGVDGSTVTPSNEALSLPGNSIKIQSPGKAKRPVGSAVTSGKSYTLSFIAKAAAGTDLNLSFTNNTAVKASFAPVRLTSDWQIFRTNLADLNHAVATEEFLLLEAGQDYYIDNITLTEIVDRYYLIKDSWRTPASCDEEAPGVPHEKFMLGCAEYTDRADKTHYLKQFSKLCSESAVGCELMIDTHNSTNPFEEVFNSADAASRVTVPKDSFAYVVYDEDKLCESEQKGCEFLGKPYSYETATLYGDVYLKNNPDKYDKILCAANAVGCQAYSYDDGESYFKDPGDQVCEWRRQAGAGEGQSWLKKKVKRCGDNNGAVCLTNADCSANVICQLETSDNLCPTSDYKTFGFGGIGNKVSQPANNWAGICAASESGCSEYLDPLSKFNTSIIFNGSFQDLDLNSNTNDGWEGLTQNVVLEANTVYRLARKADAGALAISCPAAGIYNLDNNNNLSASVNSISLPAEDYDNSRIFYSGATGGNSCMITAGDNLGTVELKKVAIDYQLKQNLDRQSCNGIVNYNKNCVLFNERKQSGAGLAKLDWDADITVDGSGPISGADADKDANIIIKVTPDRVCDKWLACRSYIKDEKGNNTCYDVGLCDGVDENGNCNSFIRSNKTNQAVEALGADKVSNLSGYAKVGLLNGSLKADYYPLGAMKQAGEMAYLANGNFEIAGSNGYPLGWVAENTSWNDNIFKVINNPIEAQNEGIGRAIEGQNFLKLGSTFSATSEFVEVVGGAAGNPTSYVITANINTINLKSGSAKIKVEAFNSLGQSQGPMALTPEISLASGNGWTFKLGRFDIFSNDISQIKVILYSDSASATQGNFYFDNIQIRPALNSKDNWYTAQACRLYPESDSLSCDYYEDSGARQKGWYGYCLEYDRAPGDPNTCLLWYPIDKVKGDGVEEGAGYNDRFPVYYCTDLQYYNKSVTAPMSVCAPSSGTYPASTFTSLVSANEAKFLDKRFITSISGWGGEPATPSNSWAPPTYVFSGMTASFSVVFNADNSLEGINYAYTTTHGSHQCGEQNYDVAYTINYKIPYCKKIVQAVTSVGQNKYWSARMYKGTDYVIPNDPAITETFHVPAGGYTYLTDYPPFGGVKNPYPSSNPYEWDSRPPSSDGNQPLFFDEPEAQTVRAGSLHSNETVKRIFAKSYGAWQWQEGANGGHYEIAAGSTWGPPTDKCLNNIRPIYPNDYCAIPPAINNIKVNAAASGNVTLFSSQFASLTFNSQTDSQQLPLVMYAVDWGDGEQTIVSGVEMRDRPNADNPHSLYHLYSYWDLKAKSNQNQCPGGSCNSVNLTCSGGSNAGDSCIDCLITGECKVKPKIKIKDNWGWCNGGNSINDCASWQSFAGYVVVKER